MHIKEEATSKISFLMIRARYFDQNQVLGHWEYFVYCECFKTKSWGKRSVQIAKGEFLEVPLYKKTKKSGSDRYTVPIPPNLGSSVSSFLLFTVVYFSADN